LFASKATMTKIIEDNESDRGSGMPSNEPSNERSGSEEASGGSSEGSGAFSYYVLAGDNAELLEAMKRCAADEDDPPVWFDWHPDRVHAFLLVARAPGAPAAPAGIEVHGTMSEFQESLLRWISAQAVGSGLVGRAGLRCSLAQFGHAISHSTLLCCTPWAFAVMGGVDAPHRGPLAKLYVPRPRVANGACDAALSFGMEMLLE